MSFYRLSILIVVFCLTCFTVGRASAQVSLDLSGAKNMWFYGSYGQLGSRGFFGDYNVDASAPAPGAFASLNGWVGNQGDIGNLVSGSNAGVSAFNMEVRPKYGNDWVRLEARYNINAYNTSAAPGSVTAISPGQLTLWRVAVTTPLGNIRFGKQIFQSGFSLQFSENRTTEYIMLDRTYPVPDILGCLVGAGFLPRRAMSWFNPHLWPRYKRTDYGGKYFANKEYKEPEDEFYRNPEKNKSIFRVWEEERQAQRKSLEEKLASLQKQLECFKDAKPKYDDPAVCGECLADYGAQNAIKFQADRIEQLKKAFKETKEALVERIREEDSEVCHKKQWPADEDAYAWGHIGPACLRIGFGFFPWQTPDFGVEILRYVPNPIPPPLTLNPASPFNATSWNPFDFGVNRVQNWIGLLAYSSTDLELGVGCLRSNYHQGPEAITRTPVRLDPALPLITPINTPPFERYVTEGWAYLKYNNGRVFFNTELDWFNRLYRFQRSVDGTFFGAPDNLDGSGSLFASQYRESWRYMAETGFWYGPFSAKAFYCFMPGPDRRHGIYIDRQPFIQELPQQAFGLFDPYSILLAYRYGSGVNAPAHISDASVYAVKLDYALASNLIVSGSFLRAIRNTNGYAWGYIRPNTAAGAFGSVAYGEPPGSIISNSAPSIPDRDLGWEAMGGFVWELLDGWALSARLSYWKPGRWFNYACIDKSVPGWNDPSTALNWGIRPDRVIDPVFALEIQVGASY